VARTQGWGRPGGHPGPRFYTFHFTFEQQPAVQQLAAEARDRLAGFPALDLVPPRWLHLTTQGIGFADAVSDADMAAIVAAARRWLPLLPAANFTLTTPQAESEGIVSWVLHTGGLSLARDALRAAIASTWGAKRVPEGQDWDPHVSFAYANQDADGGPYDAALQGMEFVPVTAAQVDLIRLGRDRHVYEWETIASIPLGG
jgi:hypothetical protein